jgi:hypothetical protein
VRVGYSVVDAWEDLRVGDRVRVFVSGNQNLRPDVLEVVELRPTDEVLSPDAHEAVALVRGSDGVIEMVSARILRRV